MKFLISIFLLAISLPSFPQSAQKPSLPKYNPAAEAVYKGAVLDVRDRECPVSGSIGTHILMKLENGNTIEVTGWKTEFQGVQTIFAREVKYGNDTYVFRTKDGMPAWVY